MNLICFARNQDKTWRAVVNVKDKTEIFHFYMGSGKTKRHAYHNLRRQIPTDLLVMVQKLPDNASIFKR